MWFSVLVFLLITLMVGIHSSIRVAGKVRNYYVAGNIIPSWVIVLSLAGQAVDVASTETHAELSLSAGFWIGAALPLGIGVSLLLIGLFCAERIHKLKLLTLVDFYLHRYNPRVEFLAGIICITSFIFLLASNLAGVGVLLHFVLGIEIYKGVVLVALVVLCCTVAGGLFAVVWNDVLHVGVIVVGFVGMLIWLLFNLDSSVISQQISESFSWQPLYKQEYSPLQFWAPFVALAIGDIVALDFMERVFAAKTGKKARQSCLLAGGLTILVGLIIALISLLIPLFTGDDKQVTFLQFVANYLPVGLGMMVFMAFIAACVSTADGALMACSKVLSKNILKGNFPQLINDKNLLLISRLSAIPLMVIASVIALTHSAPGELLVIAFEVVLAGCLVPLIFGLYWSKATATAAFWSMLLTCMIRLLVLFFIPESWVGIDTLLSPICCAIIFVIINQCVCSKTAAATKSAETKAASKDGNVNFQTSGNASGMES